MLLLIPGETLPQMGVVAALGCHGSIVLRCLLFRRVGLAQLLRRAGDAGFGCIGQAEFLPGQDKVHRRQLPGVAGFLRGNLL